MDGNDDELCEDWFARGELPDETQEAPYEETSGRRSRVGVLIAAASATALTLLIVFAGRV